MAILMSNKAGFNTKGIKRYKKGTICLNWQKVQLTKKEDVVVIKLFIQNNVVMTYNTKTVRNTRM